MNFERGENPIKSFFSIVYSTTFCAKTDVSFELVSAQIIPKQGGLITLFDVNKFFLEISLRVLDSV